jgi:hypothetical protein
MTSKWHIKPRHLSSGSLLISGVDVNVNVNNFGKRGREDHIISEATTNGSSSSKSFLDTSPTRFVKGMQNFYRNRNYFA